MKLESDRCRVSLLDNFVLVWPMELIGGGGYCQRCILLMDI